MTDPEKPRAPGELGKHYLRLFDREDRIGILVDWKTNPTDPHSYVTTPIEDYIEQSPHGALATFVGIEALPPGAERDEQFEVARGIIDYYSPKADGQ